MAVYPIRHVERLSSRTSIVNYLGKPEPFEIIMAIRIELSVGMRFDSDIWVPFISS